MDSSCKIMNTQKWLESFVKFWAFKRVKTMSKMPSLPLFVHKGSSVGRTHFSRGKWTPNLEIPLVPESRQTGLSNKPNWRNFFAWKCLQNQLQNGAMHKENDMVHKRKNCYFCQKNSIFCLVFSQFDLFLSHGQNHDVN